jgi:hypothetical protein
MFPGHPDLVRAPSVPRPVGSLRETGSARRPGGEAPRTAIKDFKMEALFPRNPVAVTVRSKKGCQGCFLGTQTWSAPRRFRKGDRFREETGGRSPQNRN